MQRRDFINLFIATWSIAVAHLFNRSSQMKPKPTESLTGNFRQIAGGSEFQLPESPPDGFIMKISFTNVKDKNDVLLRCHSRQTFFNRTSDLVVDVEGTFLFIYSKYDKMWLIETWYPEFQHSQALA